MTQEEKDLLLQDLSARLPYGVIVSPIDCGKAKLIGFKDGYPILFDLVSQKEYDKPWEIEYIKPYLRPMSSMTEEEKLQLYSHYNKEMVDNLNKTDLDWAIRVCVSDAFGIDWLNVHHFDYRGLIEKGIAIAITKENNPYEA